MVLGMWWLLILVVLGVTACTASFSGSIDNGTNSTEESNNNKDSNATRQQKSALNKAKTYSDSMNMSKAGIYDQLTSEAGEQFPEEDAQYAIDNLEANYKENALQKAKDYADQQSMSNDAIFDQLTSSYGEKFTEEEAQYAIDNLEE